MTPEEVFQLADLKPGGVRELLNKKSTAYKKCQVEEAALSNEELAEFLADKPRAIKRPLLTDGKTLITGFNVEEMEQLL